MKEYIKTIVGVIGIFVLILIITGCTTNVTGNVVNKDASKQNTQQVTQTEKLNANIEIIGSDTMLQVVSNLAEAFKEKENNIKISVTGGGSGTGIASLINGEIDIADSSRKIKSEELQKAKDKGQEAIEIPIARDTLSVIVNPKNPIDKLTIEQVSKIFKGEITNWKEVGGIDSQITLYGRQSTSGTYVYFMEEVVKADYSTKMRNMEGSQAIVDAVSQDKTAIGYTGIGYVITENKKPLTTIKTLNIAKDANSEYITPLDEANIKTYPISRELYQYLANKPAKDSAVYKFMIFIISDDGQNVVEKSGFVKMSEEEKQKVIERIN
jgi:phosphate transport system substrate-binding protein